MFTKEGLEYLYEIISDRDNKYRSLYKKTKTDNGKQNPMDEYKYEFDVEREKINIKTTVLKNVFKDLSKLNENGDNTSVGKSRKKSQFQINLEEKKKRLTKKYLEKKIAKEQKLKQQNKKNESKIEKKENQKTSSDTNQNANSNTESKTEKKTKGKQKEKKDKEVNKSDNAKESDTKN
jgi:hypothetical protein